VGLPMSIQLDVNGAGQNQIRTYLSALEDGTKADMWLTETADQHWLIGDQGNNVTISTVCCEPEPDGFRHRRLGPETANTHSTQHAVLTMASTCGTIRSPSNTRSRFLVRHRIPERLQFCPSLQERR